MGSDTGERERARESDSSSGREPGQEDPVVLPDVCLLFLSSSPDDGVPFLSSSHPGVLFSVTCSRVSEPGLPRLAHTQILVPVAVIRLLAVQSVFFSVPTEPS